MPFLLSELIGAPSELQEAFPGVVALVSEGILFPTLFRVCEFFNAVGVFKAIRQCTFKASWAFLAYRRLAEIDWEDVCCVG